MALPTQQFTGSSRERQLGQRFSQISNLFFENGLTLTDQTAIIMALFQRMGDGGVITPEQTAECQRIVATVLLIKH